LRNVPDSSYNPRPVHFRHHARPRSPANPTRSPRHRVVQPLVLPLLLPRWPGLWPHRRLLLHRPEPDRPQGEVWYHRERLPRRPMLRGVLPVLRARAHGPRAQGARHLLHGADERPAARHPRALQHVLCRQVRTATPTPAPRFSADDGLGNSDRGELDSFVNRASAPAGDARRVQKRRVQALRRSIDASRSETSLESH